MPKCRVLSLDGGGAWALIQVLALAAIYTPQTCGHEVLRDFDVIAANSGGSLVLGGLLENLTLQKLLGYYCQSAAAPSDLFTDAKLALPAVERRAARAWSCRLARSRRAAIQLRYKA